MTRLAERRVLRRPASAAVSPADKAPRGWRQIVSYLVLGGANTGLAYGLYVLLVRAGVNFNIALAFDYLFGIAFGYAFQRRWTFGERGPAQRRSIVKYVSSNVAVFGVNFVLLNLFERTELLEPVVGQAVALVVVTLLAFVAQKYWVFRRPGG